MNVRAEDAIRQIATAAVRDWEIRPELSDEVQFLTRVACGGIAANCRSFAHPFEFDRSQLDSVKRLVDPVARMLKGTGSKKAAQKVIFELIEQLPLLDRAIVLHFWAKQSLEIVLQKARAEGRCTVAAQKLVSDATVRFFKTLRRYFDRQ